MLHQLGESVTNAAAADATAKADAAEAAAEAAAALDATAKADAAEAAAEAYTDAQLDGIDLPELAELTQEVGMLDDTVGLDPAAASFDLSVVVPAGSVIIGAQLKLVTAVTGASGAARVGLGTPGDANKYGMTAGLTSGLTISNIPDWKPLAVTEYIRVYALGAGGGAAGTIGGSAESLKVRVMYVSLASVAILRAAHVVFYHPLDDFTEYTRGQAWAGSGVFVPGKIGSAESAVTADGFSWGALNTYDTAVEFHEMAKIDSSRVLLAFKDGGTTKVRVCTVSGSDVTVGSEFSVLASDSNGFEIGLATLGSARFLLASRSGNVGKCIVATVSGTSVTLGAEHEFAPFVPRGARAVALDSSRVAIAYSDYNGGAEDGYVVVATVSGTDVTFGTKAGFGSGLAEDSIGLSLIDSGRAALSWRAGASAYLAVASFSGTDVSYGASAPLVTTADAASLTRVATLTASKVVALYHKTSNSNSWWVRIGTVSGSAVTVGAEAMGQSGSFAGGLCTLDSQTFAVLFFSTTLFSWAPAIRKGTVSGTSVTFGGASTPFSGTGSLPPWNTFDIIAMSDMAVLAAATKAGLTDSSVAAGTLGLDAAMTAPTPGAYPTAVGATRVVAAMWARNLTGGSATVTVERGYRIDMAAASVSLGGAAWSGAGVASLMAALNDGSSHLLVVDFENTAGSDWRLRTSVDGAAWVDRGAQDSGSQAVATADTAPRLAIATGEAGQWIDELVMWAGDKAAFAPFAPEELANLRDLADAFGEPMNRYG